jgi:outer membrane protein OmpA-like peptidoglycan-associated protein
MGVVKKGFLVVVLGLAATGCQNKLHEENKALWQQNQELQAKYNEAATAPKGDPAQVSQLQGQLAERDAKISDLQNQLRQPATGGASDPGIAGIETSFNKATGDMTVNVPGDVLFDAGRATLKESAKGTLNTIAGAIKKDYAGKHVFVDGHTDADPITKTKSMWQDNLDLSAARARAVAQYLKSDGITPTLVDTRAFGSTVPKKTKEASRRVEIVVATR